MKAADLARITLLAAGATIFAAVSAEPQTPRRSNRPAATTAASPLLSVTATSPTNVSLQWSSVPGALYDVYRRTDAAGFQARITNVAGTLFNDTVSANASYYYFVRARTSTESADSNKELATTVAFTDEPIVAGQTIVNDEHLMQLRTAVNYARAAAGLAPATWSNATLNGQVIRTEDVEELRSALNAALSATGVAQRSFTDAPLVKQTTPIKKIHIKELRQGVKGIQPGGLYQITSATVSEAYFSPNGDDSKDTTTLTAASSSADTTWSIAVHSSSGATVRTVAAYGPTLSFTWDGRSSGGAMQPEGTYTFVINAVDGIYNGSASRTSVVDVTTPAANISAPAAGTTLSNLRQDGSTSSTVTGTATDTHLLDWTLTYGSSGGPMLDLATGTSPVSSSTLAIWSTGSLGNGPYDLRLQVRDRAGNSGTKTVAVTVAHFSTSQSVYQANTAANETIRYTSVIPFPVTETLTIRNEAGTPVRTLVNASRAAGTYHDDWNGRNDGGALLPDGAYSYVATVTDGSNVTTWDLSNQMRGTGDIQTPYPDCSAKNMPRDSCSNNATRKFDLWANDPLKIHYSVAEPSRVSVVFTDLTETTGTCGSGETCLVSGAFRAAGSYTEAWSGMLPNGSYVPTRSKLTVVRRTSTFPKNYVVLYGSGAPVEVKNLVVTPQAYGPEGGSMKIEFDLATFANAPATVTLEMVRQPAANVGQSTLQTVTLSSQAPGHVTYYWDGKAQSGHWVAPGDYGLVVTGAANGGTARATNRFTVIY